MAERAPLTEAEARAQAAAQAAREYDAMAPLRLPAGAALPPRDEWIERRVRVLLGHLTPPPAP